MPTLADLAAEVATCTLCRLSRTRTQTVFARGDPAAPLLFIGEGPGAEEDRQGLPFVGRSGQLLDRLIGEELGLDPSQVQVTNVVRCRPPGNRDPQDDEVKSCSPYLERQLELVRPAVVVTLGNFAARFMLGRAEGVSRLRGRSYDCRGAVLVPTFHPSYVLRNGGGDALVQMRADFARAKQALVAAGRYPAAAAPPTVNDGLLAITSSPEATRDLGAEVASLARAGDIFVLAGDLGTGKTVWVQGFARGLGVAEPVTSPTFTLLRPYKGQVLTLLHADLYRLDHLTEIYDLDLLEQLEGRAVACIEWGDFATPMLPANLVEVRFDYGAGETERTIGFRLVGVPWAQRAAELATAVSPWSAAG